MATNGGTDPNRWPRVLEIERLLDGVWCKMAAFKAKKREFMILWSEGVFLYQTSHGYESR